MSDLNAIFFIKKMRINSFSSSSVYTMNKGVQGFMFFCTGFFSQKNVVLMNKAMLKTYI